MGSKNLEFNYYFSPNLESYWVCFYDFILHELFLERVEEFKDFSTHCRDFYSNVYLIIPYNGICFISERPTQLHTEIETGFLSNPTGPAMGFKDGYELYALSNILIEKEMLNYGPTEIMGIKNTEQRLVLIRHYGVENMLDHLKAKTLDTFNEYVLHSIILEGNEEKLLEMRNPSEPKSHYEFVPPKIQTCQEAMAWRFGIDTYLNPVMKA